VQTVAFAAWLDSFFTTLHMQRASERYWLSWLWPGV